MLLKRFTVKTNKQTEQLYCEQGDCIAVGANGVRVNGIFATGVTYTYCWNGKTWKNIKYTASDAKHADMFGVAVAISNDRIIVGAPGNDEGELDSGSVYIFDID